MQNETSGQTISYPFGKGFWWSRYFGVGQLCQSEELGDFFLFSRPGGDHAPRLRLDWNSVAWVGTGYGRLLEFRNADNSVYSFSRDPLPLGQMARAGATFDSSGMMAIGPRVQTPFGDGQLYAPLGWTKGIDDPHPVVVVGDGRRILLDVIVDSVDIYQKDIYLTVEERLADDTTETRFVFPVLRNPSDVGSEP